MGIEISIIIVNYNTIKLVSDCINSICKLTSFVDYEIIVVDNNSEDILELKNLDDKVHVLQLEKNIGFGRANNAGAKIANGKILFFLNPDTLLLNDAISILYHSICSNDKMGVCGGNLYDSNNNPIHSYDDISLSFSYLFKLMTIPPKMFRNINRQHNFTNKQKSVGYITGADIMIRKSIFDKLGGFSKDIFMYYEDIDLCYRVKKMGYKIISVPTAKIVHLEGQSAIGDTDSEKAYRKNMMSLKSQIIFLRNNHSKLYSKLLIRCSILSLRLRKFLIKQIGHDTSFVISSIDNYKRLYKMYHEKESIN